MDTSAYEKAAAAVLPPGIELSDVRDLPRWIAECKEAGISPAAFGKLVTNRLAELDRELALREVGGLPSPVREDLEAFELDHGAILADSSHPAHSLVTKRWRALIAAVAVEAAEEMPEAEFDPAVREAARQQLAEIEADPQRRNRLVLEEHEGGGEALEEYRRLVQLAAMEGDADDDEPEDDDADDLLNPIKIPAPMEGN